MGCHFWQIHKMFNFLSGKYYFLRVKYGDWIDCIPIFEYTPLQVKQSVVGYGRAEKKQVQEMTRIILNLDKIPKPDDAADALAMAVCHCHCSGSVMGRLNTSI